MRLTSNIMWLQSIRVIDNRSIGVNIIWLKSIHRKIIIFKINNTMICITIWQSQPIRMFRLLFGHHIILNCSGMIVSHLRSMAIFQLKNWLSLTKWTNILLISDRPINSSRFLSISSTNISTSIIITTIPNSHLSNYSTKIQRIAKQ